MAIGFSCSCGRKINAKDEHAGKKAKCPACGQVITVPSASAGAAKAVASTSAKPGAAAPRAKAAAPKPAPVEDDGMYDMKEDAPPPPKKRSAPAAAEASPWGDDDPGLDAPVAPRAYTPTAGSAAAAPSRGKGVAAVAGAPAASASSAFGAVGSRRRAEPAAKGAKLAGGFHLGGFAKFIIGAAILIPTTFFIIRQGPVKAVAEWDKAETDGESDIRTVLMNTIHHMDAATMPPPDPTEKPDGIPYHPQVDHFFFVDPPTLMWRMPDSIEFEGRTTFGDYKGVYWTRKRELQCDMEWKGSDKLKLDAKCDQTGNVAKLLIDGIPHNDKAALSKKFDGFLSFEADKPAKTGAGAGGGAGTGGAGAADDEKDE